MKATKPVIITRPDGKEVRYESGKRASEVERINQATISSMCTYDKSYQGYKGRFAKPGEYPNATQEGVQPKNDVAEHQNGNEGGKATEASGGNSVLESPGVS